jgi:hypothetical protein
MNFTFLVFRIALVSGKDQPEVYSPIPVALIGTSWVARASDPETMLQNARNLLLPLKEPVAGPEGGKMGVAGEKRGVWVKPNAES